MMSSQWNCLTSVLLFCAAFQPIVCPSKEMFTTRRDRSSFTDTSDNINNIMENNTFEHRSRKPLIHHLHASTSNIGTSMTHSGQISQAQTKKDTSIFDIFKIGSEPGLTLFNTTMEANSDGFDADSMQSDQSFLEVSSRREQEFKKPTETNHPTRRPPKNSVIIFPDSNTDDHRDPQFNNISPQCGDGKPFCTRVQNYPKLKMLGNELSKFEIFFGDDLAPPKVDIRIGTSSVPNEQSLCDAQERIIYPQSGESKDSNWLWIVNDGDHKQGVRVEECDNPGAQCKIINGLPSGYNATCKQNYIYRSLVAIMPNGSFIKDHFRMPSCCQCVLTQPGF